MSEQTRGTSSEQAITPRAVMDRIEPLMARNDWRAVVEASRVVPLPLTAPWLEVADATAFALSRLRETDAALAVLERAYELEPTRRRASCLTYVYYDALLEQRCSRQAASERDLEADRSGFRRWIEVALSYDPPSLKDLYRLGMVEAQVEDRHDAVALRLFEQVIEGFRELEPEERRRRGDLHRYYVKALYAAARSALRLGQLNRARAAIFECLRQNEPSRPVEPVFAFFLAGKVSFAIAEDLSEQKGIDHEHTRGWAGCAERLLRRAIDAPGPPRRDFVIVKLAELARLRGDLDETARWIDEHLPPHRRKASVWRLVGEVHRQRSRPREALLALQNALHKDRAGRHLTLTDMGQIQLQLGDVKGAIRSFRQARKFRRRRYLSEHRPALRGLVEAYEARGDLEAAAEARRELDGSERREHGFGPIGEPVTAGARGDGGRREQRRETTSTAGSGRG